MNEHLILQCGLGDQVYMLIGSFFGFIAGIIITIIIKSKPNEKRRSPTKRWRI